MALPAIQQQSDTHLLSLSLCFSPCLSISVSLPVPGQNDSWLFCLADRKDVALSTFRPKLSRLASRKLRLSATYLAIKNLWSNCLTLPAPELLRLMSRSLLLCAILCHQKSLAQLSDPPSPFNPKLPRVSAILTAVKKASGPTFLPLSYPSCQE